MAAAVDRVTDRLGKRVDPGIRETVIVLNLLGLSTRQSCEGHVSLAGHGHAAPWVDLLEPGRDRARLKGYLAAFYAPGQPDDPDVRLFVEEFRLGNGGGSESLEAVRVSLKSGGLTAAELDRLRARLSWRRAEMVRFTSFLNEAWAAGLPEAMAA